MINWFIEEIYKFYENPSNLAEFEKWKKERKHNDEVNLDIEGSSLPNDSGNSRFN